MKKSNILFVCKTAPWKSENGISGHFWNLSQTLAKIDHNVTIVCGTELGSPENSYIRQGLVITEIPYLYGRQTHGLSEQAKEYFFKQAIKKWMDSNQEKFDLIKEEKQKYSFTTYDKYCEQLNEEQYPSSLPNNLYQKVAI
jgi:hypothetical protein